MQRKFVSVRTAWAIHAKKFVIQSNGSGCLFKKIVFKDKFEPSFHLPKQLCHQPLELKEVFLSGHVAKLVHKRIMNSQVSFSAPL